jgi:hypothetical protein
MLLVRFDASHISTLQFLNLDRCGFHSIRSAVEIELGLPIFRVVNCPVGALQGPNASPPVLLPEPGDFLNLRYPLKKII